MKKLLNSLRILVFFTVLLSSISTKAQNPLDHLEYTITNNEVTITAYTGTDYSLVIPSEIEGYPVTKIGPEVFSYNLDTIQITLPDSLKEIGYAAFKNTRFSSINLPDGLTLIGEQAFESSRLYSIVVPDSVTAIGALAFANSSMINVTLGAGLVTIGMDAFFECEMLYEFEVSPDNQYWDAIDGVLMNKSHTEIVKYPENKTETSYTVPSGITTIKARAFSYCNRLYYVTLPEGVVTIEEEAFLGCAQINRVLFPSTLNV